MSLHDRRLQGDVQVRSSGYLLSPARRAWPLVGLALALSGCGGQGTQGPVGPQGDPGAAGATGSQGDPGADGASTLVDAVSLARGDDHCPYGGTRYDTGLDNGDGGGVAGDGALQPGEVDDSRYACNAPATFDYDIASPTAPAGASVIDTSGGDGGQSGGRAGDQVFQIQYPSGGNVQAFQNGTVDTSFDAPVAGHAYFGTHPLVVPAGTTEVPEIVSPGAEGTLPAGTWFHYDGTTDDHLYEWTGGSAVAATGVHVEAGATLLVPESTNPNNPPAPNGARLVVPFDVQNEGTLTTRLVNTNRYSLAIWATNYWGGPSSQIDLRGADPGSGYGGEAGGLWIFAVESPESESDCSGTRGGGVYNQGSIDGRPGGVPSPGSASGASAITLCGTKAVYNTGVLAFSGGDGFSGRGGAVTLQAVVGGVYNAGTIDVSGGQGGILGGSGGRILLTGTGIWNSGDLIASGADVPSSASCAEVCNGGDGGEIGFQSFGGPVRNSGALISDGGSVLVAGNSSGGSAGRLSVQSDTGTVVPSPPGSIEWTGDIHLVGGGVSGATADGGYGGEAVMVITGDASNGDPADGQSLTLYGYTSMVAAGGDGATAGPGGYYILENIGGSSNGSAFTGATYNEVPLNAPGGQGVGTDSTYGGEGGLLGVLALDGLQGPHALAINVAPLEIEGGSGTTGGVPGTLVLIGTSGVQSSGEVHAAGGAGDMTNGGSVPIYGGEGSLLSGQEVSITADIDMRGADGAEGGAGRTLPIYGGTVDIASTIDVSGGDGNSSTGSGGAGGLLDVFSTDAPTVVTGALVSDGGGGATPGAAGEIDVEGFPWQAGGQ